MVVFGNRQYPWVARDVIVFKNPKERVTKVIIFIRHERGKIISVNDFSAQYYHLRSTVKHERFFAHVYFSTVSQTTESTEPMKMFHLGHETMNVCQRNVAHFGHVECMFEKVNDIFQGFGILVSLRLQKDGRAKRKQIWTNLSHWNTDGLSSRCEELYIFFL